MSAHTQRAHRCMYVCVCSSSYDFKLHTHTHTHSLSIYVLAVRNGHECLCEGVGVGVCLYMCKYVLTHTHIQRDSSWYACICFGNLYLLIISLHAHACLAGIAVRKAETHVCICAHTHTRTHRFINLRTHAFTFVCGKRVFYRSTCDFLVFFSTFSLQL